MLLQTLAGKIRHDGDLKVCTPFDLHLLALFQHALPKLLLFDCQSMASLLINGTKMAQLDAATLEQ